MGRLAGVALTTASIMLIVVAIPLNSPALFYMSTAMIATIIAARVQAWLAVRALRIERFGPEIIRVGEPVTIDLTLWTELRVRRPLITLADHLPKRLVARDLTPTLPIAPAYGNPVQTHYSFTPLRRGKFRWQRLTAIGTDALGLVSTGKAYDATPVEMTVLPAPIPVSFDLTAAAGWGFTETEHGRGRGLGLQPRGVREYVSGDSLRYVHWPSTARRGQLLVKEFETGSQAEVAFFVQLSTGSEIGAGANTTLEHMCSNLAYLTGWMLRQGIDVAFPGLETEKPATMASERESQVLMMLAEIQAEHPDTISAEIARALPEVPSGSHLCVLVSLSDPSLPGILGQAVMAGHAVTVLVYDALAYVSGKGKPRLESAGDQDYLMALRAAGCRVSVVGHGGKAL